LIDVDLAPLLTSLDLEAFSGHPDHPLQIDGVYLRREPFITLQLIRKRVSKRATQGLHHRGYLDGWTTEALDYARAHSDGYLPAGGGAIGGNNAGCFGGRPAGAGSACPRVRKLLAGQERRTAGAGKPARCGHAAPGSVLHVAR
jgi:hypothetical protein